MTLVLWIIAKLVLQQKLTKALSTRIGQTQQQQWQVFTLALVVKKTNPLKQNHRYTQDNIDFHHQFAKVLGHFEDTCHTHIQTTLSMESGAHKNTRKETSKDNSRITSRLINRILTEMSTTS